jgi:hypothetical protein
VDGGTERLDALEADAAPGQLEREFPGWRTWKVISGMCHATPRTGPTLLVRGEDPVDLRDQLLRAQAFREGR